MRRRERIRRIALTSLLSAVALVLSYLEAMIPLPVSLPGVKLGLANVAVAVGLVLDGPVTGAAVALVKALASGLLFGSPMMLAYSLGGTALAYLGMLALSRVPGMGLVPVCMLGAILHNVGQLAVAALALGTPAVFASLPPLAVAACATGSLTGGVAQAAVRSLSGVRREGARPRVEGSLDLAPGERVALVGRNGSGKTTFALELVRRLNDAADAATPTGDEAARRGGSMTVSPEGGIPRAGMALQDPDSQIVAAVVRDDVAFGPEGRGMSREEMLPLVRSALREVGLPEEVASREIATLSGGERQRVAVAGIVAMAPGVVVFDESTSMLDPEARGRLDALMASLATRGVAVVQVTQLMDEAFRADRVAVFDAGHIVAVRTPDELVREPELLASLGLELPPVARLAAELRARGLDVPQTNDPAVLEEALACCAARG